MCFKKNHDNNDNGSGGGGRQQQQEDKYDLIKQRQQQSTVTVPELSSANSKRSIISQNLESLQDNFLLPLITRDERKFHTICRTYATLLLDKDHSILDQPKEYERLGFLSTQFQYVDASYDPHLYAHSHVLRLILSNHRDFQVQWLNLSGNTLINFPPHSIQNTVDMGIDNLKYPEYRFDTTRDLEDTTSLFVLDRENNFLNKFLYNLSKYRQYREDIHADIHWDDRALLSDASSVSTYSSEEDQNMNDVIEQQQQQHTTIITTIEENESDKDTTSDQNSTLLTLMIRAITRKTVSDLHNTSYYSQLSVLTLSNCNLSVQSMHVLCETLLLHPSCTLTSLDISHNKLTHQHMIPLCAFLIHYLIQVRPLNMERHHAQLVKDIFGTTEKFNLNVREFQHNDPDSDMDSDDNTIQGNINYNNDNTLQSSNNSRHTMMQYYYPSTLNALNLSFCALDTDSILLFLNTLSCTYSSISRYALFDYTHIKSLNLAGNNSMSCARAFSQMCQFLSQESCALLSLDISGGIPYTVDNYAILRDILYHDNHVLQTLQFDPPPDTQHPNNTDINIHNNNNNNNNNNNETDMRENIETQKRLSTDACIIDMEYLEDKRDTRFESLRNEIQEILTHNQTSSLLLHNTEKSSNLKQIEMADEQCFLLERKSSYALVLLFFLILIVCFTLYFLQ